MGPRRYHDGLYVFDEHPLYHGHEQNGHCVMKDYGRQLAEGKKPVFKAKNIGLDDSNLDFWK